ncbi:MAG: WecB/TagA/CpsF family glycosyltransferase [Candidatus Komeilibacteria bacterium]|nr:WecB/TagA/CpsF family glycosyltransferase [Candidatus Komeilibacteria bacterium]
MRHSILDIPLDSTSCAAVADKIQSWLDDTNQRQIATINPEFLMEAQTNESFKKVLQNTALNTIDGFGIQLMAKLIDGVTLKRCPGIDLLQTIFATPPTELRVYLLGGREGVARLAAKKIKQRYPRVEIIGYSAGFANINNISLQEYNHVITEISESRPNLLLVGYNAPFAQIFINDWLPNLPTVKVAIGIGGSLDFLADTVPRAPLLFRRIGLEWLWRLLNQPRRIGRIYRAVIKFPTEYFKKAKAKDRQLNNDR